MARINPAAIPATMGVSLFVGLALLINCLHAAEPKASAVVLLSGKDFWLQAGAEFKHDFDKDVAGDIRRLAQSNMTGAVLRLRAVKLACDLAGNSRTANLPKGEAERAAAIAMAHLESHLDDPTVKKFLPQIGFTNLSVSHDPADGRAIWVLIETTNPDQVGGLNIEVDPKFGKVLMIRHWGKVRVPPPTPIA